MTSSTTNNNSTSTERVWDDELEIDYQRIISVGEECISPTELKTLLLKKGRGSVNNNKIILYDGFEPSGRMHIAQGVFKAMNVNKCTVPSETNSTFVFWVADWFALMNDKMGGDLDKIKTVGYYLIEVWKAAGMSLDNVVFKWASEEITLNANKYWPLLLDIARRFTITRIKKCCQIMGRLEGNLTAAQILYPLMQCTDVFFLNTDICQLGVDQRKVNMLAREYCDASKRKVKPIILSHHMLYGLKAGQEKMSKSDPDSAIFMEDHPDDVERKIRNAYCPSSKNTQQVTDVTTNPVTDAGKESLQLVEDTLKNPCLDYIKNIIFSPPGSVFTCGNGTTYTNYLDVQESFLNGTISEEQLKTGLINELNRLLQPVREHFTTNEHAKNLLALVQQYKKESTTVTATADTQKRVLTKDTIRRLDLVTLQKVPANSHLVFVPLPVPQPTIQMIIDLSKQLRQASTNQPCVLYLQDWCAIVTNSCDGDGKAISAYYTIMLAALRAYDPTVMSTVTVVYQSEAILCDPSNYWINVINVGRFFQLNDIMGTTMKDEDNAGIVIARLMKIADVTSIEPASIAMLAGYGSINDGNDQHTTVTATTTELETSLIQHYYESDKIQGLLTVPTICPTLSTLIRLQPIRESDAFKTDNDEYFILDDPKVLGKSKLKKAFCEPGNVSFCPPIAFVSVLALSDNNNNNNSEGNNTTTSFEIVRSPENGGTKIYTSIQELNDDFVLGESVLHPGDLKGAVTPIVMKLLETIASAISSDKTAQASSKTLKAFLKKKK